ncbi:MAG: nitroreductase family deazaflavin-dependent oxidoreductase [Roseiflexaceae bacterium]|nr:nitroreductase family deazaflavin-dependent oxidoreductase [Roseiflexaceae bacterium]
MRSELNTYSAFDFCYLTTIGRVTGREHTIEIWFALNNQTLYMLAGSGENADWVKNARRTPAVRIRIGDLNMQAIARIVNDTQEDALARALVVGKYQPTEKEDLGDWGLTALPVAFDLEA